MTLDPPVVDVRDVIGQRLPDARRVEGEQHHGEGGEVVQLLREVIVLGVEHRGPEPGVHTHLITQGKTNAAQHSEDETKLRLVHT